MTAGASTPNTFTARCFWERGHLLGAAEAAHSAALLQLLHQPQRRCLRFRPLFVLHPAHQKGLQSLRQFW